jgi:hypothetical protein
MDVYMISFRKGRQVSSPQLLPVVSPPPPPSPQLLVSPPPPHSLLNDQITSIFVRKI